MAEALRVLVVATSFEPSIGGSSTLQWKLVEKNLLRLQHDQYVALSNYTGKRLLRRGIDPEKIKVVPPGIDYGFWENSLARPERFRETQGIGERQVYSSFGRSGISKGF